MLDEIGAGHRVWWVNVATRRAGLARSFGDFNVALSKRRAESLINYLVKRHGFDRQRFVSVGNGPDNPVTSNATPEGREKNRRTDFKIIPNK
jgi:outer membrane protein OmpA-like peptidoglycan-associated protein